VPPSDARRPGCVQSGRAELAGSCRARKRRRPGSPKAFQDRLGTGGANERESRRRWLWRRLKTSDARSPGRASCALAKRDRSSRAVRGRSGGGHCRAGRDGWRDRHSVDAPYAASSLSTVGRSLRFCIGFVASSAATTAEIPIFKLGEEIATHSGSGLHDALFGYH
jgi:hypothetical protein